MKSRHFLFDFSNSIFFIALIEKTFSFIAKDADTIKDLINEPTSRMIYVILAQALDERVPPFVLQIFGTNNSFTAREVVCRWNFTKTELQRYVICNMNE